MLERAEVWTTWPDAGGTRKAIIDLQDPVFTTRTGGEGGFTAKVRRGDATGDATQQAIAENYAELKPGRVLRLMLTSKLWRDVEVLSVVDGASDGGMAALTAGGLSVALAKTPPIQLTTGARVSFTFDGIGLTPEDQVTTHCKPQWDAAGLTFLEVGEFTATPAIDVSFDGDTAWSALAKIGDASKLEPSFRWDLENGVCYLDMVPRDGSIRVDGSHEMDSDGVAVLSGGLPQITSTFGDQLTGDGPRLEVGHNAAIKRTRSSTERRNRIYGVGAGGVGVGDAVWVVSTVVGSVIGLVDLAGGAGPILVDDQLDGYWLEADDRTTRVQISASNADDQEVTVSSAAAFAVGERVRIRAASDGTHLTALTDPGAIAANDGVVVSGTESRPDLPETVNLMLNADQSVWTGGSSTPADGWAAVGSPTLTRTTTAAHRQIGPYSCRVQTTADGQGYASPLVTVKLGADSPFVSGFLSFKLVSGAVRVELVATDGVDSWIFPDGTSQKATTTATGVWVQVGVAGLDLLAMGITSVRMRLVQDGPTAAEWYVDAGQVTESAGQLPLVIGAGPTQLWQAVNTALALDGLTRVRYEGEALDFHRLDPATYPDEQLIVGALHTVVDHALGEVEGVRLLELAEHLHKPAESTVTLSSLPGDLRSLRARVARPRRNAAVSGAQLVAGSIAARVFYDGVTTSADKTVTSASAALVAGDDGATLWLFGAGASGAILKTTVDSVTNGTTIETNDNASASLTNVIGIIGTPEGVLTLAAGLGSGGGAGAPGSDGKDVSTALIEAQLRELARRLKELEDEVTTVDGDPGGDGGLDEGSASIVMRDGSLSLSGNWAGENFPFGAATIEAATDGWLVDGTEVTVPEDGLYLVSLNLMFFHEAGTSSPSAFQVEASGGQWPTYNEIVVPVSAAEEISGDLGYSAPMLTFLLGCEQGDIITVDVTAVEGSADYIGRVLLNPSTIKRVGALVPLVPPSPKLSLTSPGASGGDGTELNFLPDYDWTWNPATDVLEMMFDGMPVWSDATNVNPTFTGLTPNTWFEVKARVVYNSGANETPWRLLAPYPSANAGWHIAHTVPLAPTGEGSSNLTSTSVDLDWTDGDAFIETIVYQQASGGPPSTAIYRGTDQSLAVTGLTPNTTYDFFIMHVPFGVPWSPQDGEQMPARSDFVTVSVTTPP